MCAESMLHASLKNIRASRSGHFTEAILEVDDGTQGLTADQIAPRNSHGELLVEALASCERLSTPPVTCLCLRVANLRTGPVHSPFSKMYIRRTNEKSTIYLGDILNSEVCRPHWAASATQLGETQTRDHRATQIHSGSSYFCCACQLPLEDLG